MKVLSFVPSFVVSADTTATNQLISKSCDDLYLFAHDIDTLSVFIKHMSQAHFHRVVRECGLNWV